MAKIILILFLFLSTWDMTDKSLFLINSAFVCADGYTTHLVLKKGGYEKNRYMGEYPSDRKLILTGIAVITSELIIADLLPGNYRKLFITFCIIPPMWCTRHNYLVLRMDY